MNRNTFFVLLSIITSLLFTACASTKVSTPDGPIIIQEQGSFAVGGTVITNPGTFDPIAHGAFNPANQSSEGQTLHGDHAYVFYQIPAKPRQFPFVFWHGYGQFSKTWETTPDGREGFQNIFLRRNFPVYLIDQPRRGGAARSTKPINIAASPDEGLTIKGGVERDGIIFIMEGEKEKQVQKEVKQWLQEINMLRKKKGALNETRI